MSRAAAALSTLPRFARARLVLRLAAPYRRQFLVVAIFALLATGADLLAPIIYREAVNDIAGLFVGEPGTTGMDELLGNTEEEDSSTPRDAAAAPATPATPNVTSPPPPAADAAAAPSDEAAAAADDGDTTDAPDDREPHGAGKIAPRTAEQALRTLLWAVALLFVINVVSHGFALVADQRTVQLASRIEADVIQTTFGHVLQLPLAFFARRASGGLAKQIDQSDKVSPIVTAIAHQIGPEAIRMAGVLAIMLTQSWKLTLVALVTLPPYLWIVQRSSRRLETGLAQYYEMWDGVSGRIQDALGAIKTVKLSGAEAREAATLVASSDAAYATYVERNRLANRYVFWQTSLSYLSQALVLGYGGWLVLEKRLTPGDVVMFVVYLDKLYSPIESLTQLAVTLQENFASLARAVRLMQAPGEEAAGEAPPPGPGRVEFRDVTFGYVPGRDVLQGVSFALEPGRVTALVGPSGAGKTTAVDLLLRLYEPRSGDIVLDGAPLATLGAAAVRREVAVVAADGAIFRGSIADNIRYKRPDATDEDVRAAALAAGLGPTLERLADGLASDIGERGMGLSMGERQRVQIARALVGRPRVIILDEATANLDYATEREIRRALLDSPCRPTTLVVAHRYSMVESADHVIVLEAGRVVERGTPAQLRARGGWFARFAASAAGVGEAAETGEERDA